VAAVPDAGVRGAEEEGLALAHEAHGERLDHRARARGLRSEGDLAGALAESRRALLHAPEDEELLAEVARLSRRSGEHALAARAFASLARVRSTDALPLIQQAREQLALGDTAAALRTGADALARDAENPEVYQVLGRAHLAEGDLSLGILRLERAVELDPEHGWALNNLGFAYLRANENPKAVAVLTRAAALLPHEARVHNNLGVALERTGEGEAARDAFARATSLSPRYVKARVNSQRLGQVASAADLPSAAPSLDALPLDPAEPALPPAELPEE
jgi:Flp pilus assembly protein TadD